jgi:hypothetical protein
MANRTQNYVDELLEQLARDNKRREWNAIDRARGFASLLMAIYREKGVRFQAFEELVPEGACDRIYYAQVAAGELYRIPRGKGQLLSNAIGLKNTQQLRDYRALLRLPDNLWDYANTHNLTEFEIYEWHNSLQEEPPVIDIQRPVLDELEYNIRSLWQEVELGQQPDTNKIAYVRNWLDQIERQNETSD